MSGLCGWFAQEPSGITLERMAAPIARFERTPLKSAFHARGAVALSGSIDCTSLLQEEGLIVALWGSPGQHAHTLAQRWRSHGAWAGAALSGQFAFVILDAQRGEALVAVDRFATRPLFYQQSGASLLFASSQDALLRHPLAGRDPSAQALYQYLVLGAMPASAWDGQHQLGPGECVHLRAGKLVRHTWWRMRFDEGAAQRGAGLGVAVQAAAAAHGLANVRCMDKCMSSRPVSCSAPARHRRRRGHRWLAGHAGHRAAAAFRRAGLATDDAGAVVRAPRVAPLAGRRSTACRRPGTERGPARFVSRPRLSRG
jgi:hypothetical protein